MPSKNAYKYASTFTEEFRKREWKSKKLRELAEKGFKTPHQSSTPKNPWWLYDGEDNESES